MGTAWAETWSYILGMFAERRHRGKRQGLKNSCQGLNTQVMESHQFLSTRVMGAVCLLSIYSTSIWVSVLHWLQMIWEQWAQGLSFSRPRDLSAGATLKWLCMTALLSAFGVAGGGFSLSGLFLAFCASGEVCLSRFQPCRAAAACLVKVYSASWFCCPVLHVCT